MALQHFYSRIPARVSMYHKTDGFDTFAQSDGLEQEFVERDLAPVCENKLNKIDVARIRRGEMPCVYTQCTTRSGIMMQNCIRYLPVDYTGERSAYLSHTLVLTNEEKAQILSAQQSGSLNPELFITDIGTFQIEAPDAVPVRDYPCVKYSPAVSDDCEYLLSHYSEDSVRALLYAILYAICGKGRNVCFKLPGADSDLSALSVRLFNELLSILPYQLRTSLSFASYVTDPAQFANYKLRGVSADFPENAAKCACIDFETNLILGVQHDEVVANKPLLSFFYLLLGNKVLREDFLAFMKRAADTVPGLQSLNLKVLGNLVFLFQCSSGLFPEQEILPNDTAVYDYLSAYEKYRDVLSETYRMQGYSCLRRYPDEHRAIPKNILAKVSKLYGAESCPVKRIVMDAVLELIHTDVMRDKLFTFIRNNYQHETAEMKQIIITDLCRVFYGGFLQNQLLTFFSEQFPGETEASRSLILEKLLLSIRTPAVQSKVLAFVDEHYNSLSEIQKDRIYDTVMEMLPECDALAAKLMKLANQKLEGETEERRSEITRRLISVLDSDCRRKERSLLPLMADCPGISQDLVIRQVFGPWQTWKVHADYMEFLGGKNTVEKTEMLARIFSLVPELNLSSFTQEAVSLYEKDSDEGDLYLWLHIAEKAQSMPPGFSDSLNEAVIAPAVTRRIRDVFDISLCSDGMKRLKDYAERHPKVRESEQYGLIVCYDETVSAAKRLDYSALERSLPQILKYAEELPKIAEYLKVREIDPVNQSEETVICLELVRNLLKDGAAGLDGLYRKALEKHTAEEAMILLLSVCGPMSQSGPVLSAAMTAPGAGVKGLVEAFVSAYGKGAYHRLRSELPHGTAFGAQLEEKISEHKKANSSFWSRLLGKK